MKSVCCLACVMTLSAWPAFQRPAISSDALPALPKIDHDACPFEGCVFGDWKARVQVRLYSTWELPRQPLRRVVERGEVVNAVTGVHITYAPDLIEVLKPLPQFGLKPGDTIRRYMTRGEGLADFWANGHWLGDFNLDGLDIKELGGFGCRRDCPARVKQQGKKEWWVEIKTTDGVVGWTKDASSFAR